ncbi:MAG: S26 family signal peptidase [Pirellulales bacterium]
MAKKRSQSKPAAAPAVGKGAAPTVMERKADPPGAHRFFNSPALRETVESVVVAFVLAFLFRTFEAEAFVIPTGSMAPTLMGAHKDVLCPTCGYRYAAGASSEADDVARQRGSRGPGEQVVAVTCPMCRTTTNVDPRSPTGRDYPTYGGDRILVTKFNFEFSEPRRWDVTVFKFPGGAETNYIKRLVGLPNETVRLWHGDLYVQPPQGDAFHLERRPPDKLRAMAQIVYDNDFVVDEMTKKGWPVRWGPWPDVSAEDKSGWKTNDGSRTYQIDGSASDVRWLGYRHYAPSLADWELLDRGSLPAGYAPRPRLITDFYAYNTSVTRGAPLEQPQMLGLHWVGDLLLQCQVDVTKSDGKVHLELIEGGRHFRCAIETQSGEAQLSVDGLADFEPKAQTPIIGPGSHEVIFANIDDQLRLWVDGTPLTFDGPTEYPPLDNDRPRSDNAEPGDLLPARIGAEGVGLSVSGLRLWRDLYYIATDGRGPVVSDYRFPYAALLQMRYEELLQFWSTPAMWSGGNNPFDQRQEAIYPLDEDQFFMLGDNSPLSLDARLWDNERYVRRDLLIGKALYVFWPHSFHRIPGTRIPFPFFPNFARMGFIR